MIREQERKYEKVVKQAVSAKKARPQTAVAAVVVDQDLYSKKVEKGTVQMLERSKSKGISSVKNNKPVTQEKERSKSASGRREEIRPSQDRMSTLKPMSSSPLKGKPEESLSPHKKSSAKLASPLTPHEKASILSSIKKGTSHESLSHHAVDFTDNQLIQLVKIAETLPKD